MNERKTILLVEDDARLLNSNRLLLEGEGYHVLTAGNLARARESVAAGTPDLVVLDILLPDGNGLDFLQELRCRSAAPVLFLTALGTNADMVKGLEAGGDDYLAKPFDITVFLAKVKSILRRAAQLPQALTKGALRLSIASGRAFLNGVDMLLPQKEYALLLLFAQNENRLLAAESIYEKVWEQPMHEDANAIRFQISRMRKKLAGSGYTITAVYGGGYRFEAEPVQEKERELND